MKQSKIKHKIFLLILHFTFNLRKRKLVLLHSNLLILPCLLLCVKIDCTDYNKHSRLSHYLFHSKQQYEGKKIDIKYDAY